MPTVALIAIVLLGIAALGTDVFLMYWTQQNLQRASDAAALAGATYLSHTTFSGANVSCTYGDPNGQAKQAACTYALANGVLASEIQSITVVSDGICATPAACTIAIVISRTIAATFARLLGFTQFTVKAQAVAGLVATGQTYNMIPIGLDGSTPYTYGQAMVMHSGNCGSGCWGGSGLRRLKRSEHIRFPAYEWLRLHCYGRLDLQVGSFTGAKTGPVGQAISQRISNGQGPDPSGTAQSHSPDDPRVATVGLVTWGGGNGANQTATVTSFAEVWLTGTGSPPNQADINAIFIDQVVPGASALQRQRWCNARGAPAVGRGDERIKLGQSGTSTCCAVLPEVPNYWACRCTFSAHF